MMFACFVLLNTSTYSIYIDLARWVNISGIELVFPILNPQNV